MPDHTPTRRPTASSAGQLLESHDFKRLVAARWGVSLLLSSVLGLMYYGYILLIAVNPELLARRVGERVTLGIPLGAAVIVGAWLLTFVYVLWANRWYDPEVRRLKARLHRLADAALDHDAAGQAPGATGRQTDGSVPVPAAGE